MRDPDHERKLHRAKNQRRIAFGLVERINSLLEPGLNFNRELNQLFRQRGNFGSKDRRLYRELIFTYLRYQPWLEPLRSNAGRFLDSLISLATPIEEIMYLYPTLSDHPPELGIAKHRHFLIGKSDEDLVELLPDWLPSHLAEPLTDHLARTLFSRPPLWLRMQKGEVDSIIEQLLPFLTDESDPPLAHATVPCAIRCHPDLPVSKSHAYQKGEIEIQDISSQLLIQLIHPDPEGHWLDACAGAGGKTLQLAQILGTNGSVTAFDTRFSALTELESRKKRAGLKNVRLERTPPKTGQFQGVLVDAPCSGSGTWRRHPFLMRQLQESDILARSRTQSQLLDQFSDRVAFGGLLVYMTCSLSRFENEVVSEQFLKSHPSFQHAPLARKFGLEEAGVGLTVTPDRFDGDGLYVAAFRKT